MTTDEINAPEDKALAAEQWNLLLEEARAKIKPVLRTMSEEELDSLCSDINDLEKDKEVIIFKDAFYEIMERNGITLEELRKI
jgi:hypothetical protein